MSAPVDELELRILYDIARVESRPNRYNWMNSALQGGVYGNYDTPAMRALAEAWAWLYVKGLVAPDSSQSSSEWVFVTRLGQLASPPGDGMRPDVDDEFPSAALTDVSSHAPYLPL